MRHQIGVLASTKMFHSLVGSSGLFVMRPMLMVKFSRYVTNLPDKTVKQQIQTRDIPPVEQKKISRFKIEYHGAPPQLFNDESLWYPIYKFPNINLFRRFVRFKVYLTLITTTLCMSNALEALIWHNSRIGPSLILLATSMAGMTLAGNMARRFICQIYTSEDMRYVRLCRLSFFAKRIDLILPIECIVPLSETNTTRHKVLLKLRTRPPPEIDLTYDYIEFYDDHFTINLTKGGIIDEKRALGVLGHLIKRKDTVV